MFLLDSIEYNVEATSSDIWFFLLMRLLMQKQLRKLYYRTFSEPISGKSFIYMSVYGIWEKLENGFWIFFV